MKRIVPSHGMITRIPQEIYNAFQEISECLKKIFVALAETDGKVPFQR